MNTSDVEIKRRLPAGSFTTPVIISTINANLDLTWVIKSLRASYWGGWMTPDQIVRAADNSLCFGAYEADTGQQIGFARVVTDRAVSSIVNDVIVAPEWRGKGVGRSMLEALVRHPAVAPTICILASRDAAGFYAKFGFVPIGGDVLKRDPR